MFPLSQTSKEKRGKLISKVRCVKTMFLRCNVGQKGNWQVCKAAQIHFVSDASKSWLGNICSSNECEPWTHAPSSTRTTRELASAVLCQLLFVLLDRRKALVWSHSSRDGYCTEWTNRTWQDRGDRLFGGQMPLFGAAARCLSLSLSLSLALALPVKVPLGIADKQLASKGQIVLRLCKVYPLVLANSQRANEQLLDAWQ